MPTTFSATTIVDSGLNGPIGLVIDKNGNLFCSNIGNETIVKMFGYKTCLTCRTKKKKHQRQKNKKKK